MSMSHYYTDTDTLPLLLHVIESPVRGYVNTVDTITWILCTLLFLIHVPLVHGYTNSQTIVISYIVIIVTWMLDTQLYHVYTSLSHMHVLFLYSCHMDHRSYYMSYYCMYIHVFLLHDCFPLLDTWAVDMRCVELSATWISATEATFKIPHLLYIVSHYLVSWYQQS